ncbi:hypothetical protein SAMN05444920_103435 [Nonomuraea solani]|uniref:DUF5753 domain-containing protein n=1 Tax=Nonomuraea solani TaxID=1144553 RepID=A0A1H6BJI1_9ACTN|nr:hypothetical protein SAMN05444920_103435 [Nonomuraea solani]
MAAAVEERLARQSILRQPGRTFAFLLEEAALRYQLYDREILESQLVHLEEVTRLPSVSLGIIPLQAARAHSPHAAPVEGFTMFDDGMISVELVSGHLQLTQKWEIALYAERFAALANIAVYGPQARRMIAAARGAK